MRKRDKDDGFQVQGVADRLAQYETAPLAVTTVVANVESELVERAATLLAVLPRSQPREKIERMLSPNDPERARRAVDALIDSALAVEDQAGRIRKVA